MEPSFKLNLKKLQIFFGNASLGTECLLVATNAMNSQRNKYVRTLFQKRTRMSFVTVLDFPDTPFVIVLDFPDTPL